MEKYLGKTIYEFQQKLDQDEVGIVRGLAWTSAGGDTLEIEVNLMPGKGNFELTGQLGDVMQESAKAGISYIRSVSEKYELERDYFQEHDIHIHIPEGAVPKDGPSAGITMATAMLSAILEKPVRADVAMTRRNYVEGPCPSDRRIEGKTAGSKECWYENGHCAGEEPKRCRRTFKRNYRRPGACLCRKHGNGSVPCLRIEER